MSNLADYTEVINRLKKKYEKETIVKETLTVQYLNKVKEIDELKKEKDEILLKKQILINAAKEAKNNAKLVLETVNTNTLKYIFGEDVKLKIDMNVDDKKGAELVVVMNNNGVETEVDPANEDGGGLADIVSLCSFNSISQLTGKDNKAPIFLDEPTKFVSKGNLSQKATEYLKDMSEFIGKQVFLVTHDEFLSNIGDKTYRVVKEDGVSTISEVE